MTTSVRRFIDLSDRDLLAIVHHLAADERRATASLIASLAELVVEFRSWTCTGSAVML